MTQTQNNEPATAMAGPVRITRPDGTKHVRPAYTGAEVAAIIKQGRERPRPLTADETSLVARNRAQAAGDAAAMERWYSEQCSEPLRGRALFLARHPGSGDWFQEPTPTPDQAGRWW